MKFQILFSEKNEKNITSLLSAELAQRVVKVKYKQIGLKKNLSSQFLLHRSGSKQI